MNSTPNSINDNNQSKNRYLLRKRGLEHEPNDTPKTKAAKTLKSHTMPSKELSELKDFFNIMKTDIEKKIIDSQTSIESKLNDFTSKVKEEVNGLKNSVDELKSKLGTEIDTLSKHITEHTQRLDNNEDDVNRVKLSADLKIIGIPFEKNEVLTDVFHKIAAGIGFDSSIGSNVPFMKRIPIRDKKTGVMFESHTISVHFMSAQQKQAFYSSYLSKMPLNSEALGMKKDIKIIIGESLTSVNSAIFKYAQLKKKENKLAQTYTADGLVKIKFTKGPKQRAHIIRSTMQLDVLIAEHELTQKQQQQQIQQQQQTQQKKQQQQNQQQQIQTNVSPMAVDTASTAEEENKTNTSIELLPHETLPDKQHQPAAASSNNQGE